MSDDVLVCQYELRPRGAPSIFDIAPLVRRTERDATVLTVEFAHGQSAVQEYVSAERLCCPDIAWNYDDRGAVLHIHATPGKIATLHEMFLMAVDGAG